MIFIPHEDVKRPDNNSHKEDNATTNHPRGEKDIYKSVYRPYIRRRYDSSTCFMNGSNTCSTIDVVDQMIAVIKGLRKILSIAIYNLLQVLEIEAQSRHRTIEDEERDLALNGAGGQI